MGAFAAMAQNDYGITILGIVAFAFGFLFIGQLMFKKKATSNIWSLLELISLSLLAVILGLRVFYIHFALVEMVFGISGVVLVVVYAKKLIQTYSEVRTRNRWLSLLVASFHVSIIFYSLSMVTVPFFPALAEPLGAIAFTLLVGFIAASYLKKDIMLEGEKISGFKFVGRFKDRSVVLASLFLLFTLYLGFTKIDFLPKMYSDEYPQSYFQLIDQAEKGIEKPANGKYKHEELKEMYDAFVKRNTSR
jgi:hypothetical protein